MNGDDKTDYRTWGFHSEEQFSSLVLQEHGIKFDESSLCLFLSVLCVTINVWPKTESVLISESCSHTHHEKNFRERRLKNWSLIRKLEQRKKCI